MDAGTAPRAIGAGQAVIAEHDCHGISRPINYSGFLGDSLLL